MATPDPACPVLPHTEPAPEVPTLAIQARVMANYGDHAETITKPVPYVPGETVEALLRRALPGLTGQWQRVDPADYLEIRPMPAVNAPAGAEFAHWKSQATLAAEEMPPF